MSLEYVSGTQIQKYRLCPRRWHFEYVGRQREEATESMDLGSRLHEQVEEYLRDEVLPEHVAALRLVRTPGFERDGLVEVPLSSASLTVRATACKPQVELSLAGIPVKGFVDLWTSTGVVDHKFTGRAQNFATPKKLKESLQMRLYAHAWLLAHTEATECRVTHNCATFDGTSSKVVTAVITREESDISDIEHTVQEMKRDFTEAVLDLLDNDGKGCYSYGRRCPFTRACGRSVF
jgi:CRISPR/Cas system-associated exonuclease Cas4 (RecB family)